MVNIQKINLKIKNEVKEQKKISKSGWPKSWHESDRSTQTYGPKSKWLQQIRKPKMKNENKLESNKSTDYTTTSLNMGAKIKQLPFYTIANFQERVKSAVLSIPKGKRNR